LAENEIETEGYGCGGGRCNSWLNELFTSADGDIKESALRLLSVCERFADESFNYQKMKDHTLAGLKVCCFDRGSLVTRERSGGGRVRTPLIRQLLVTQPQPASFFPGLSNNLCSRVPLLLLLSPTDDTATLVVRTDGSRRRTARC
jgi:hypothetical protein